MNGLNQQKVDDFIQSYPEYAEIISDICSKTLYFTTAQILDGLRKSVSEYKRINPSLPLYVVVPDPKKSGQWIYNNIKDLLPEHKVKRMSPNKERAEYLYIDDWSLSGCNASFAFENLFYKTTEKCYYTMITFVLSRDADKTYLSNDYKFITTNVIGIHMIEKYQSSHNKFGEFCEFKNVINNFNSF